MIRAREVEKWRRGDLIGRQGLESLERLERGDRLDAWRPRGEITVRDDREVWTRFPADSPPSAPALHLHLLFFTSETPKLGRVMVGFSL